MTLKDMLLIYYVSEHHPSEAWHVSLRSIVVAFKDHPPTVDHVYLHISGCLRDSKDRRAFDKILDAMPAEAEYCNNLDDHPVTLAAVLHQVLSIHTRGSQRFVGIMTPHTVLVHRRVLTALREDLMHSNFNRGMVVPDCEYHQMDHFKRDTSGKFYTQVSTGVFTGLVLFRVMVLIGRAMAVSATLHDFIDEILRDDYTLGIADDAAVVPSVIVATLTKEQQLELDTRVHGWLLGFGVR